MEKKFITLKELCARLDINNQTIYRYVRERKIPFKKRFQKLYFDVEEIDRWIAEGVEESQKVTIQ